MRHYGVITRLRQAFFFSSTIIQLWSDPEPVLVIYVAASFLLSKLYTVEAFLISLFILRFSQTLYSTKKGKKEASDERTLRDDSVGRRRAKEGYLPTTTHKCQRESPLFLVPFVVALYQELIEGREIQGYLEILEDGWDG